MIPPLTLTAACSIKTKLWGTSITYIFNYRSMSCLVLFCATWYMWRGTGQVQLAQTHCPTFSLAPPWRIFPTRSYSYHLLAGEVSSPHTESLHACSQRCS